MKERTSRMFQRAATIASTSTFKRARIGAVAACGNEVLSVGVNSRKTHPKQMEYDKYRQLDLSGNCACLHALHAEIACLSSLEKRKGLDWSKVELYIYRQKQNNNGETVLGMSRPCPACMNYIKDKGIRRIHYTTDDGYAEEVFA